MALVTGALALLSSLIVLLAAVNVGQTLFAAPRARAREIAVMRAVGATRGDNALVLIESLLTGLAGGVMGAVGARALAVVTDYVAATRLPDFPFRPNSFFSPSLRGCGRWGLGWERWPRSSAPGCRPAPPPARIRPGSWQGDMPTRGSPAMEWLSLGLGCCAALGLSLWGLLRALWASQAEVRSS